MKKKSFMHTLDVLTRIQIGMITAFMVVFVVVAYQNAVEKQETVLNNYLEVFGSQMKGHLTKTCEFLSNIVYNNYDLEMLQIDDDTERQYAAIRLSNDLEDLITVSDSADVVIVAQEKHAVSIQAKRDNVTVQESRLLSSFAADFARTGVPSGGWEVLATEEGIYLYRALVHQQRAMIGFVSTDTLFKNIPIGNIKNACFLLADGDGAVLHAVGDREDTLSAGNISELDSKFALLKQNRIGNENLYLYVYQSKAESLSQLGITIMILFVVILTVWCFTLYFSSRINRELLTPMGEMTRDMEKIKTGQYDLEVSTKSDSAEFEILVQSFNKLIHEVVCLKLQSYEKQIALLDAEQKYIRLQIRPHFFLNAMTTIVGLGRAGKNAEIETYINALSKNIRYMFSAGLHTVPLQEELRHVENYFEMQELKYPGCVLYFVDTLGEVDNWRIPQMLIHTIVENEYKYAVDMDSQLMVLIKLRVVDYEGEQMLLVEIEDNGNGYPEHVIHAINTAENRRADDTSHVGLWSIRRLLELMYDKQGLFQISNVEPHGALSKMFVPAQAANQRAGQ